MRNTLQYKGYEAILQFDADEQLFFGKVLGTRDVITFEGSSVRTLQSEFRRSINDYLALCEERGIEPDTQPSGEFRFRPGTQLHRQIAVAAAKTGKSINEWLVDVARQHAENE